MRRKNIIPSIYIFIIVTLMCLFFYTPQNYVYGKSQKTLEKAEMYNTATPKPGVIGDTPYAPVTIAPIIVAPPAATSLPVLTATLFPTDTETQPPTPNPTSTVTQTSTITPTATPTATPQVIGPIRIIGAGVIILFIIIFGLIVYFLFSMYSRRKNV